MPLLGSAIVPHVTDLIPRLARPGSGLDQTRTAISAVCTELLRQQPESIILITPHGVRVDGAMALARTGFISGALDGNGQRLAMRAAVDLELLDALAATAGARAIPVATIGFGGNRLDQADTPMDWATFIPLWYLGLPAAPDMADLATTPAPDQPRVVIIVPSRQLARESMVRFGQAIATSCEQTDRRVVLIASSDWAHTHAESGPYGAHPAAATVDAFVLDAIRRNDLHALASLPETDIEAAALDGLWQTLILAGAQDIVPMRVSDPTYEIADYVSVMVAGFRRE